jgi:CRP/FNR family transcriptional regulator, cyclic AMP receptor protein
MSTGTIANESQIDKVAMLKKVALFEGLTEEQLQELAALCYVGTFPAGDEIIEQGSDLLEEEDGLYILLDGTVEVRRDSTDGTDGRLVATLSPSEFFGEMALLDGYPRSASVYAKSEVMCLMLSRWDFQRQLRAHPEIAMRVLAVLSGRIRRLLETV